MPPQDPLSVRPNPLPVLPLDPTRPGVPVLPLHTPEGPVFWPLSEVQSLRDEWDGRVQVTARDGRVAHGPGPLPPARALVPPDPHAVLAWSEGHLLTPAGPLPDAEVPRHPDLVRAGRHRVHPGAIRALRREGFRARLLLEGGHSLTATWSVLGELAGAFGLSWPDPLSGLPPHHRLVYEQGLRDWPEELLRQPVRDLRQRYASNPQLLVDHVIWESFRLAGRGAPRGQSPRGLFYNPLKVLASRAGILGEDEPPLKLRRAPTRRGWTSDRLYALLQERLEYFVGIWRHLAYQDLGFVDRGQANRRVGGRHPHVVLLVEKASLEVDARLVAEAFDVSMLVLGGFPAWIATEFFARALGDPGRPVLVVALTDFDPYGWWMPEVFREQLLRYGLDSLPPRRLVLPGRFTREERELLSEPVPVNGDNRTLVARWLEATGGIDGQARSLYADFFRPVERLVAAFREETGLEP